MTDWAAKLDAIFNVKMHPILKKYVWSLAPIKLIIKGNQGGGCLDENTDINLYDGSYKKIKDVSIGDYVLSIDKDFKIKQTRVKNVYDKGLQVVYELKTRSGRYINATDIHPFLTINGWKKLKNLIPGEYIATPRLLFNNQKLINLSKSDIFWDKIVSIERIGVRGTYDLEIEGTHNFIANNIFAHNTTGAMYDAALRVLGIHPVEEKNRLEKPIRFVSKVVPNDHNDESNQQFVEFRRLIPPELWKKELTARSKVGKIARLCGGIQEVEFMASTQDIDAFMSVQRGAYYQDEEIERVKWDENTMRLASSKSSGLYADTTLSMTPVKGMDWSYDSLWKRAEVIHRSKTICDKFGFPSEEKQNIDSGIEVFCWATEDNPIMTKDAIDTLFQGIDDPDELAMRRYGVFRQVSGRIYKVFDSQIHVIPVDKIWDAPTFRRYWHYRIIDFHPSKPWYVTWLAVTPTHEWFVWNELIAYHDKKTTYELRDDIKSESLLDEDEEFNRMTILDPLAKVKQGNTGRSPFEDLSGGENGLRRCQAADTKNRNGRIHIKTRLKNSIICGIPGNNINKNDVVDLRFGHYLPTLWFLDTCKGHIEHFRSWRYIDYKQAHVKAVKTVKRESEKWSDFCRNLEFLGALNPVYYDRTKSDYDGAMWFRGRHR